MKLRLLEWLMCPRCESGFVCTEDHDRDGEIESGRLVCDCGAYPIVNFIPRLMREHWEPNSRLSRPSPKEVPEDRVLVKTRASFGYQWTAFGKMTTNFEENFLNYIAPIRPSFFPGKLGLDAGCGFGRHMFQAAKFGAEIVGLDASQAIDVARRNVNGERAHFVQGDLLNPPFRPGVFDFVYCLGVLHHLTDPEKGFRTLQRLPRKDGAFWIWVYSKKRSVVNSLLECVRAATTRMPYPLLNALSHVAATLDYGLFVVPARTLQKTRLKVWIPERLGVYAAYPFQVSIADWFDRLAAPVRFYYDETDLSRWAESAGWDRYRIEPTGLYGFRLQRLHEVEAPCVA